MAILDIVVVNVKRKRKNRVTEKLQKHRFERRIRIKKYLHELKLVPLYSQILYV